MRALLLVLMLTSCGNCGQRPGVDPTEQPDPSESTATATDDFVVVRGVVRLAEGATIPEYPAEALRGAGPAADPPAECPADDTASRRPVTASEGGLTNVMVTATGDQELFFDALGEWEPQERTITIRDCRLQPPLLIATRGDTLVLETESDYPFMVGVGRTSFMEALLRGTSRREPLNQGGVQAIRCGFAAPCGRADVVVVYHPVFTVTGQGGRFSLRVPPGQPLEIHAWHPLFEDTTVTVTVPEGESREIELVITPAAQADSEDAPVEEDATELSETGTELF